MNGTVRVWGEGLNPGEDYNCRCYPDFLDGTVDRNTPHIRGDKTKDNNGNRITVRDKGGVDHHFYHMKDQSPLLVGDSVTKGDIIGEVGNTGRSTGPHLHYETRDTNITYDTTDKDGWKDTRVKPKEENIDYLARGLYEEEISY